MVACRYTLSHAHLSADVASLLSSTAMSAWLTAKASVAILIDHGAAAMGSSDAQMGHVYGQLHVSNATAVVNAIAESNKTHRDIEQVKIC